MSAARDSSTIVKILMVVDDRLIASLKLDMVNVLTANCQVSLRLWIIPYRYGVCSLFVFQFLQFLAN